MSTQFSQIPIYVLLIYFPKYKNINIFWIVEQKIIVLTTLYFTGVFLFLKKNIFEMYVTKYFMRKMFYCWCAWILFPVLLPLYHWIHCISVQTEFLWMYVRIVFSLCCFGWENIIHNKKILTYRMRSLESFTLNNMIG